MIDWVSVSFSVLWIFGLGLMTSALSIANYFANQQKRQFREVLKMPVCRMMINLGLLFFCLGWTGGAMYLWERITWAVLALLIAARIWQVRKTGSV